MLFLVEPLYLLWVIKEKFGLRYLSIYFWNPEIVGLLEKRPWDEQ